MSVQKSKQTPKADPKKQVAKLADKNVSGELKDADLDRVVGAGVVRKAGENPVEY